MRYRLTPDPETVDAGLPKDYDEKQRAKGYVD